MFGHIVLLSTVMLIAGFFGGLVNFQMGMQRDPENTHLVRCIVVGIGAAFLVPVILDVVSSDLITSSSEQPSKLLIFVGFCLIASMASRLFMTSLSERTLHEARLAAQRAQDVEKGLLSIQAELFPLIETETEDELSIEEDEDEDIRELLDVTSASVLKTLDNGEHIFRSLKGICMETNTDEATIARTLSVLMARNYVGRTNSPKGIRWYITEKGRRALKDPF